MADLAQAVDIPTFYAGRSLFLTGGTGFLGKVLLEKLLRSCPEVQRVYLLVRGKGAQSPHDRLAEMFRGVLFERLKKEQPNFADKVVPIPGELTNENLGMSEEDMQTLVESVSIVIHSAATVKFTEKIKLAVDLNVLVVRRMIEFSRKLKNLACFMHISTAYAHTNREVIEERVYEPSIKPSSLISLTEQIDDGMADALTPHFLGQRPNSYTFTKSIAEYIVASEGKDLPAMIFRPSIVSSTWKDPIPGWIDNYNGPTGVAYAVGTGCARILRLDDEKVSDVVPVDVTANYILASAWFTATRLYPDNVTDTPVFNCVSSGQNPCLWETARRSLPLSFSKCPLEKRTVRRVKFDAVSSRNKIEFAVRKFVQHTVPAHVLDMVLKMTGQKPMAVRMFRKMERSFHELSYFTCHEWKWEDRNFARVSDAMTENDRKSFFLDMTKIHWPSYYDVMCMGVKKYLAHENTSDLRKARTVQATHAFVSALTRLIPMYLLTKYAIPVFRVGGVKTAFRLATLYVMFVTLSRLATLMLFALKLIR